MPEPATTYPVPATRTRATQTAAALASLPAGFPGCTCPLFAALLVQAATAWKMQLGRYVREEDAQGQHEISR